MRISSHTIRFALPLTVAESTTSTTVKLNDIESSATWESKDTLAIDNSWNITGADVLMSAVIVSPAVAYTRDGLDDVKQAETTGRVVSESVLLWQQDNFESINI